MGEAERMIERAARAAYIECAGTQGDADAQRHFEESGAYGHAAAARNWDDASSSLKTSFNRDDFRRCARAAIVAMREPTEEMIAAADYGMDWGGDNHEESASPQKVWVCMIDEITGDRNNGNA